MKINFNIRKVLIDIGIGTVQIIVNILNQVMLLQFVITQIFSLNSVKGVHNTSHRLLLHYNSTKNLISISPEAYDLYV